ncbi:MAG: glycosyltransferase [Acidobacteria bacterium]|nr:glycosyltransferase [Acidobacteriota bacterium]
MLTGHDIVCLSTQDWNGLWTRKQRFMKMFAENGNRVLYVETPVHLLGLDVLPKDLGRFFRFLQGPRLVEDRLFVGTLPILLPMFQMFHSVNSVNQGLIAKVLRSWIRRLGFKRPVLWIYTPFSAKLIDGIEHTASIYECVDEFRASRGFVRSSVVGELEDELLRKVQLTVVTQENLLPHRASICPNTVCIPNGADVRQFKEAALGHLAVPREMAAIPRPILGLVGHIHYWIDLKLIRFLAERKPEWSFVLIGPANPLARTREIRHLPNVRLLGRKPQTEIPAHVQAMDCCLNPYVSGMLSEHVSPLKLYEYLAAGKPVVSTDMPEARKFAEHVRVADSHASFLSQCETALACLPELESVIRQRLNLVAEHSWENRFERLNRVLDIILTNARDR